MPESKTMTEKLRAQEESVAKINEKVKTARDFNVAAIELPDDRVVVLPGGTRRWASEFLGHKYASIPDIERKFLADPAKFVKQPDPAMDYLLPDSASIITQSRIKARVYIPVKEEELDDSKMSPTHTGEDGFVHWYRHVLVKCRKADTEAMYKGPEAEAIRRLTGQLAAFKDNVAEKSKGYATGIVKQTITKE